jgi:hypothetical protein
MKEILAHLFQLCGLLLLLAIGLANACSAEALRVLERHNLDRQYDIGYALCVGNDSLLFTTYSGLYVCDKSTYACKKLMDCYPPEEQVPFSVCDIDRLDRLVLPSGLWQYAAAEGSEILVFDGFCNRLYCLRESTDGTSFLTKCDKRKGDDMFDEAELQNGVVLSGLWLRPGKETVVIQRLADGDYRRVFRYPQGLARWRDSIGIGLGYVPFCDPALNPHDSTLWLAIQGYNFIYVTDMDGNLLDSVPITLPDFRMPPPLKSRMKSGAVVDEWGSQWTSTTRFSYVSPGYFLMQYITGQVDCGAKERSRFTTVVWDAKRQLVPLSIDPLWRVAGVQDDGRVIFVAPEADSSGCKETLIVGRIEP